MTYVIVHDVPATWEQYEEVLRPLVEPTPEGLILHAAGKTDEGYRTVDVWESKAAWERFRERSTFDLGLATVETRARDFNPEHVILAMPTIGRAARAGGTATSSKTR